MTEISRLAKPLRRFLQVLVLIWALTLVFGSMEKNLLHLPESSWYPFFLREARFTDLTVFRERFDHFGQSDFFDLPGFPFNYPAPVAFALESFFLFGKYAVVVFISFCVLAFGFAGVSLGRAIDRRGLPKTETIIFVGSSLLLSYPFWILIDRANMEVVNWCLVAVGVWAYWNKKWYLAATFLGLAISFKIFPFVFLGLLLSARQFRAILWALLVSVVSTLVSIWCMGHDFLNSALGVAKGLQSYKLHYMLELRMAELGFDHSLLGIIKILNIQDSNRQHEVYLLLLNRYMMVAALLGIVVYFWKIWKLPRPNQILALTVASILAPPVSADYRLTHLYIPWAVLVLITVSMPSGKRVPGLTFCFMCLAFLMAPEGNLFLFHGVKLAGPVKAVVLLMLFIASISYPFEEPVPVDEQVLEALHVGSP